MLVGLLVGLCSALRPPSGLSSDSGPPIVLSRRALLPTLPAAFAPILCSRPASAAIDLKEYTDSRYGVSFGIPSGWSVSPSELPDGRRIVTAADPADIDYNVFCTFTPIRPE